MAEITHFMGEHQDALQELAMLESLQLAVADLTAVTDFVVGAAGSNPEEVGAAATEYLHMLGYVMYAYMWAKMALAAGDHRHASKMDVKLKTADFYFRRILPRIQSLKTLIMQGSGSLMALSSEQF